MSLECASGLHRRVETVKLDEDEIPAVLWTVLKGCYAGLQHMSEKLHECNTYGGGR